MATWKDLDWREKWNIIDQVLTIVGLRVGEERKAQAESLARRYDIVTEARVSEAEKVIAIIQGMKNDLDAVEKRLDERL